MTTKMIDKPCFVYSIFTQFYRFFIIVKGINFCRNSQENISVVLIKIGGNTFLLTTAEMINILCFLCDMICYLCGGDTLALFSGEGEQVLRLR